MHQTIIFNSNLTAHEHGVTAPEILRGHHIYSMDI